MSAPWRFDSRLMGVLAAALLAGPASHARIEVPPQPPPAPAEAQTARTSPGPSGLRAALAPDTASSALPEISGAAGPRTLNGQAIYRDFRAGLADQTCDPDSSKRWKRHFAGAPNRLARRDDDILPLFGYVVHALREARLPTEYALIPFVESGYRPAARSAEGPAGLWQMVRRTALHHRVPIHPGYDGRLSPVDSTRAAVRYLKELHGRFGGDWQLAVMAYNAGEQRVLRAVRRSGTRLASADPQALTGLPGVTTAYPRKLHALSCLLEQADDRQRWRAAMDREVPQLAEFTLPPTATDLREWARRRGADPDLLVRLNPVHAAGAKGSQRRILAPVTANPAPDGGEQVAPDPSAGQTRVFARPRWR